MVRARRCRTLLAGTSFWGRQTLAHITGDRLLYVPTVTIPPAGSADSAHSYPVADQVPVGTVLPLSSLGPRRGFRARTGPEVAYLIKALAEQIARQTGEALSARSIGDGRQRATSRKVLTLVATPVASWYPILAALMASEPESHVPVRGATEIATVALAVPPALDAMSTMTRGFARRLHGFSSSGRSPAVAEAELGGVWLNAMIEALRQSTQPHPRWDIRVAGLGIPGRESDGCYLLSAAVSSTLMWRPRRRPGQHHDTALAQWLLIDAEGSVGGAGIAASPPRR